MQTRTQRWLVVVFSWFTLVHQLLLPHLLSYLSLDELPFGLLRIGDCMAPNTIAAAVYDGHRAAREMDNRPDPDSVPFKREQTLLE